MPKLVIKQDTGAASRQIKYAKWLSLGGLLTLLLAVALAAWVFTQPKAENVQLEPPLLSSATDTTAKTSYESMHAILAELGSEYETSSNEGVDDYQKNLKLLGKAESILNHLDKMDQAAEDMQLDSAQYDDVLNRHQFYKDYWQAKLHFRELRVSRFASQKKADSKPDRQANDTTTQTTERSVSEQPDEKDALAQPLQDQVSPEWIDEKQSISVETKGVSEQPKKKFQFAKPPPGMELPEGFCDLSNPDSCKPAEDVALPESVEDIQPVVADGDTTDTVESADPPKKKFQFAKPPPGMELPEGFCDLSNPESCKPAEDVALPESVEDIQPVVADESTAETVETTEPPKKKFQFAKPPPGMELPEGFCDLSNPDSCKKQDQILDIALPETLDELQQAVEAQELTKESELPKRKFQFAEPPPGMKLPDGFCDLNNPDSCKPSKPAKDVAKPEPVDEVQPVKPPDSETTSETEEEAEIKKETLTEQESSPKPENKLEKSTSAQVVKKTSTKPRQVKSSTAQSSSSLEQDYQLLEQSLGVSFQ